MEFGTIQALEGLRAKKRASLPDVLMLDRDGQEAGETLLDTPSELPFGKHKFILICETRITTRSICRRGWGGIIDEHFEAKGGEVQFVPAALEDPWSYLKVTMTYQSSGLIADLV